MSKSVFETIAKFQVQCFTSRQFRALFRRWRSGRPFWAGVFTIFGGVEIVLSSWAPVGVAIQSGVGEASGLLVGSLIGALGFSFWFLPDQRYLAALLAVVLSLVAFVMVNLGGFFLGTLAGLSGGSLGFAWNRIPDDGAAEQVRGHGNGA